MTCSVPWRQAGHFAGVAIFDMQLDNLSGFMPRRGSSTGGYAFALDQADNVLYFQD